MMYRGYEIDEQTDNGKTEYAVFPPPEHTQEIGRFKSEAEAKAFVDSRIGNKRWEWHHKAGSDPEEHVCKDTTSGKVLGRITHAGTTPNGFWFRWEVANGMKGDRLERRWDAKTYVEREIIASKLL